MVDQATAASIRQPLTKDTDLSFAALDENLTNYTPTDQDLFLWRPGKTKFCLAPRQLDPQFSNFGTIPVLPQQWKSIVNLSILENKMFKKEFMEIMLVHKDFWSGLLRAF